MFVGLGIGIVIGSLISTIVFSLAIAAKKGDRYIDE